METRPAEVTDRQLVDAVAGGWGPAVRELAYVPKGFGSHHFEARLAGGDRLFLTVDDLRHKPWLGADPDSVYRGLEACFRTAVLLAERAGLEFVVAPLRTAAGGPAVRLGPSHSLAVFPFVDGHAGRWGAPLAGRGRTSLLELVARLHLATGSVVPDAPERPLELAGRGALEAGLSAAGGRWDGGPLSEPARRALAAHAGEVGEWLRRLDRLAGRVRRRSGAAVVTHGELHPGNLLVTEAGLRLVDWDTAGLAPPERDLWMLDDGAPNGFAAYRELTGRDVDPEAIALYRLVWALTDIAAYVAVLRAPHQRNRDTEKALRGLEVTLAAGGDPGAGDPVPRAAGAVRPAPASPPHGFAEDAESRRLLRSRPPAKALAWAGGHLGGRVVGARALRGGMSSAVHAVTVDAGSGRVVAVLRRYVRPEVNEEEPDIAAREARALRLVEAAEVPTPFLLAVDPTGEEAGAPALLMTRLPGRVVWAPADPERFVRRLAELLPPIHAVPLPAAGTLPAYAPYEQRSDAPPAWSRRPEVWERAVEIFHGPAPAEPSVVVQRDFHPGNVLWRRGVVTGVVDWQSASVGPAVVDVGHCRANLASLGAGVVDGFTREWERVSGRRYHPWADVVAIVGLLDDLRTGWTSTRAALEELLARAVAAL